jgi:hypothetical protein
MNAPLRCLDATRSDCPAHDPLALSLASDLESAQHWGLHILSASLAVLGDLNLPDSAAQSPLQSAPSRMALPGLYWVDGLEQAGLFNALDTIAGLWASGAITAPMPDHGAALQTHWRERHQRLHSQERRQLLSQAIDPHEFEPALERLCQALIAAPGPGHIAEKVALEIATEQLTELCSSRVQGAVLLAAPELLAQAQAGVQLLAQRSLQVAFAVRDFYGLLDLQERAPSGSARRHAEHAQAGASVLRWWALSASAGPIAAAPTSVLASAQRWRMGRPTVFRP